MAAEKNVVPINALPETKVTLEEAIGIVKDNFEIPKEFTEFTSGFSNYNYRQAWSLNWDASGEPGGSFSAQVDAVSGEILSVHSWQSSVGKQSYKLPGKTLEQAKIIADNTVKKLAGDKYARLQMVKDDNIIPLNLYGSTTYSFHWQRTENGIPFQGNGVTVQVDADNGQVMSYNLTWNTLNLPKAEGIINSQKAAAAFSQNKMLELQYFLPPAYRIMANGTKEQVKLVYQLNKNGILDAFTGKPLELHDNQWLSADDSMMTGRGAAKEDLNSKKTFPLTPQEQREIERNTTLLTKEKAIEVVKKWVEIPSGSALRTMNLNTDGSRRDTKVWYFEWASPNRTPGESITARVDAVSGELLGFSFYNPPVPLSQSVNQKPSLTNKEAQKIAEDFLKQIQAVKFQQVRMKADGSPEADSKIGPAATSLTFNYERMVNGIAFTSNGMNITVDLFTKKITSYNLNWGNLDFPQLSSATPQAKAEETFLKARPLALKYVLVYNNGEPTEVKLVYQPSTESNRVSDMMDAQTGTFLNWQGKPLTEQPCSIHFTDIAGNAAEKEIAVLGLAGIFGEYGNTFKPTENLTAVSLLRSLLIIDTSDNSSLSAEEVLKKAKERGWLKEELTPSQNITREMFSKIMIRYLGLEKIADLNTIYRLSFEDTGLLSPQSQGYISLTTGLGILKINGNKFEPSKTVTRAEAAYSIIQALGYGLRS